MKIGIGTDHAGYHYKEKIKAFLQEMGHRVRDFGTVSDESVDYPLFIRPVAEAVKKGTVERGIVLGGSGNGEAMTANRLPGIRCALSWNVETARLARAHNNANMLSLGARMVSEEEALDIVKTWLETPFDGGRHTRRIRQIDEAGWQKDSKPLKVAEQPLCGNSSTENYDVVISLRYLIYSEGGNRLEFQIDPGLKHPSVIHIPSVERWQTDCPSWSHGRRDQIVERIEKKCVHMTYELKEY
jgi:ribose 5-phosphate isomerase B